MWGKIPQCGLSSTPNKLKLEALAEEKLRKENLKSSRETIKRKIADVAKTESQIKPKIIKKVTTDMCPGCNEPYIDPPIEEWI